MSNLLARYALYHDLNVALPARPANRPRLNNFEHFREDGVLPLAEGQRYHVLFNHMIYNRSALDRLMPRGTFYCGIVREPMARFVSAVSYYHKRLPRRVRQYLVGDPPTAGGDSKGSPTPHPQRREDLEEEEAAAAAAAAGGAMGNSTDLTLPPPRGRTRGLAQLLRGAEKEIMEVKPEIYNSIASDSGLPVREQMNETAVAEHVRKLDRELDLVMIMELFPESLVLFKRRACLSTKDIVHMQLNAAAGGRYRGRRLTESDRTVVRAWQMADHRLYDHFYRKFKLETDSEDDTFFPEVRYFRKLLVDVRGFCGSVAAKRSDVDVMVAKSSLWSDEFTLNAEDCSLMQRKELVLQRQLIQRALWRRSAYKRGS